MATSMFKRMFRPLSSVANTPKKTFWGRIEQYKPEIFLGVASTTVLTLYWSLSVQRKEWQALAKHNEGMHEKVDWEMAMIDAIGELAVHFETRSKACNLH